MGSTSDNRTNTFSAIASSQFKAIKVIKTPTADMIEGSLGATIQLETFKPFDFKDQTIQYNLQGIDNSLNDDLGYTLQGLYGNNWETGSGRWGIVVNASYEDRTVTTQTADYNWQPVNNYNQLANLPTAYDHTVYRIQGVNLENKPFYFETMAFDGTVSWEPSDDLTFSLSYNRNDQERDRFQGRILHVGTAGWQRLTAEDLETVTFTRPANGEMVDDGNDNLVPVTGDLTRTLIMASTFDHAPNRTAANYETIITDQEVYGFNAEWTPGEWAIRFDAGFSETMYDRYNINTATNWNDPAVGNANRAGWSFNFLTGGDLPDVVPVFYDPSENLLDLYTYQWNNFSARFDINNLSEDAYKLDFTRNIDFAGFKLLDFGFRFASREVDRTSDRFMNSGGANLDGIRNLGDMEDYQPGFVTGFFGPIDPIFNGFSGDIPRTWVAPRVRNRAFWEEYQNVLVPNAMRFTVQNFPYDIEEETTALYIAGSFNYDWGSVPVSGNVGVRYVKTDINSTGRVLEESALEDQETLDQLGLVCNTDEVFTDVSNDTAYVNCTAKPDYSNTLPSFNINFGLRENLYLRFGAARVMSRPNPADLSPSVSIPQGQGNSGTSGNPDLNPFEADQFDLSAEWYIDQINTLTGAIFYKDVKNFITRTRTTYPSTVDNNEDGVIDDLDDVSIIRPVNGGTAEITGVEIAWQGTLDSVSDSWWGGFGGQLNYTYVDSKQDAAYDDITGEKLPYPDLSEHSYNFILFYEKYGLSARLAYNWRDASFRTAGGRRNDREGYQTVNEFGDSVRYQPAVSIFNDDYGQLDATLSYQFNPMFTVYVQGTNLTDELVVRYASVEQATQYVQSNGRTIRFGLRGRF